MNKYEFFSIIYLVLDAEFDSNSDDFDGLVSLAKGMEDKTLKALVFDREEQGNRADSIGVPYGVRALLRVGIGMQQQLAGRAGRACE